ncbi:hypothetical protein D9M68_409820 [compost metagenome]
MLAHPILINRPFVITGPGVRLCRPSEASRGPRNWLHALFFAASLTVTLYVIVDLEYPRLGLIRVDTFDEVLQEVRNGMR